MSIKTDMEQQQEQPQGLGSGEVALLQKKASIKRRKARGGKGYVSEPSSSNSR